MKGLMLHCGSESIEREALAQVTPVNGALGSRHNPVPYIDYVDMVSESLQSSGYAINDELYGVNKEGGQFFGLMEIIPTRTLEGDYISKDDYGLMVGLRGSYDQSLARGLAIGSRVFVCDNLAFSGEVNVATRQTLNINDRLPGLVNGAVGQLLDLSHTQEQRFDAYKNMELKPRWGDAAIVECVRRGVVNPSQVGKVVDEWDAPTHDEHAEYGHSLWRFHNAITEAIKPANGRANVLNNQSRTVKLTGFLDEVAGLPIAA